MSTAFEAGNRVGVLLGRFAGKRGVIQECLTRNPLVRLDDGNTWYIPRRFLVRLP